MTIKEAITAVKRAPNLGELLSALQNLHHVCLSAQIDPDVCLDEGDIRCYGGEPPNSSPFRSDGLGIWSWDYERLLVGDDWAELKIIERAPADKQRQLGRSSFDER